MRYNLFKMKYKYKMCLLGACAILVAGFFITQNILSNSNISVSVKDFSDGTQIKYKIIADGNIIKQGTEEVSDSKILKLPLPKDIYKDKHNKISYQLNISKPNENQVSPAEMLDLLVDLDKNNGNISLSGSGMDEFSDIIINNGEGKSKLTSDWAGIFSSDSVNKNINSRSEKTELAFQNYGIDNDSSQLGSGKIEILFGEPDGSSKAKVQERYTVALIRMAEELSAVMALQTEAIGMFFDASIQIKTQRKHQELRARAHKDYHPSEQMCRIGTFIRSVAHTESKSEVNKHALNKIMMNQYLSTTSSSAGSGVQVNDLAEIYSYTNYYCDPRDNNAATALLCPPTGVLPTSDKLDRLNKDIDYTRTLGNKLTLDIDYVGDSILSSSPITDDEADVIALAKNLYFPNIFELPLVGNAEKNVGPHYDSRSFAAKMNVAHSSFVNIVGMKSNAPDTIAEESGWAYMKAMLREFGINDNEIDGVLGERPSYYAQMEVLTKKIYQHPNFYTNLYDKPANIDRIGASIDAITLMHQRDRFDSLLRREMLTAILLENELSRHADGVSANIFKEMNRSQ